MEINQNQQPKAGHWDNIEPAEKKPAVKFEFDKPEVVAMQGMKPREIPWEDSVFYVFDVLHEGENKVIKTSAFTLLRGLKTFEPLQDKILKITKTMDKGKQIYLVELNEERVETE